MIDYILGAADVEDVLSMSFIETSRIRDHSTDRIKVKSSANYLFTNLILLTEIISFHEVLETLC